MIWRILCANGDADNPRHCWVWESYKTLYANVHGAAVASDSVFYIYIYNYIKTMFLTISD
jgi:hypothetical protein